MEANEFPMRAILSKHSVYDFKNFGKFPATWSESEKRREAILWAWRLRRVRRNKIIIYTAVPAYIIALVATAFAAFWLLHIYTCAYPELRCYANVLYPIIGGGTGGATVMVAYFYTDMYPRKGYKILISREFIRKKRRRKWWKFKKNKSDKD